jgi:hypothetical protein
MKRIIVINGFHKEAPEYLNETPQIGSEIAYNHALYKVTGVVYYFAQNCVHLICNKS